ncbi:hypothetical protein C2S52_003308 [Perilla frutescens var. hirtella]|nr:hypothetical protein C2S51_012185 [Perilla frutescens var. frutescens]KAH6792831.1 hypothetical protein C2S52_003308 [Perilla frutescens var. hirtella]
MEARRSANYEVSIWDDDYIQSLTSSYMEGKCEAEAAEKLKNEVKIMIDESRDELEQLELIDNLQRLGISNYFQDEIGKMLHNIWESDHDQHVERDLHATALKFRLLRQHGYHVPQEVLGSLMENLKESSDVRGLVSVYEASYLSMEGENILDLSRDLSWHHLSERVEQIREARVADQVRHSLELPLHWRVQRLEARWFAQLYETRSDANPSLVDLAKLNFNMVQATYQGELKRLSSWYKESGLPEKLGFARHRLAECFLWSVGFIPETHLGHSRETLTKAAVLITIIDDIYDVYGTLEELQLFTHTIERWDINSLERLPEYMAICFLALFNSANEFAYRIMRDQGFNVISNLRRLWTELSRAYYLEAKWFEKGYIPSTDEYLKTACVSISGPLLIIYGYLSTTNPIKKEELERLEQHPYPPIIACPSMVLRLADDLGTAEDEIKRGDVAKSIQCFINETGCSQEDARRHLNNLIQATLKAINKHMLINNNNFDFNFTTIAMNIARISLCFYQHGDGFGLPHSQTNTNLLHLMVHHIPM